MELSKERFEKKLLGEDLWVDLPDGVKIRIDYLTRAQDTEFRRLRVLWQMKHNTPTDEHWIDYYLRHAIKEARGFMLGGKELSLSVVNGAAGELTGKDISLDLIKVLAGEELLESAWFMVHSRLSLDEVDKKKFSSRRGSSKTGSSTESQSHSEEPGFSTGGNPLTDLPEERTSSVLSH